jgi:hypothetical protein
VSIEDVGVVARRLVALAELDDAEVTGTVEHAAAQAGTRLVGLDSRIKSVVSLQRKLTDLLTQDPTLSIDAAAEKVYDVLRFTVVAETYRYGAAHDKVLATLRAQGADVVAEANRWPGPGYRGINTRLRFGGARPVEVQFHTRESYAAAKATRGLYEELRLRTTPPERRAELAAEIADTFATVPIPPGAVP